MPPSPANKPPSQRTDARIAYDESALYVAVRADDTFQKEVAIKVVRRGKVRRAKLYYLRALRGKKARITERQDRQEQAEPKAAAE